MVKIPRQMATHEDKEKLKKTMDKLSKEVNEKAVNEALLQNGPPVETKVKILENILKTGADEFEKKMGRPMTYAEMRNMWG